MRYTLAKTTIVASALLQMFAAPLTGADDDALLGFSAEAAADQRALEDRFADQLNAGNLREWMQKMALRPHNVGSPYGKEVAEFIAGKFRDWGFDTKIEVFHVLFPTPKIRELELVAPTQFSASLVEPAFEADPTTKVAVEEGLPPYNAYSADGDVTGKLVYVNQGIPKDYDELERRGIDVKGKIVIARYGGSWRGIKVKVAAEHGALGCILYSDPRDDGYFQGEQYPDGAFKNDRGVQRGSVLDLPVRPGDPLTPYVGATRDAKRLDRAESETLMKIPVLPISYTDALPFLKALGGPVAPESWRGALPITYHIGPGPAEVRLKLEFNWDLVPAYNVIAKLEGRVFPNQWIVRGNHHDSWVIGASDPTSGMVALMEEARAIGELARGGWRPRRTIVYTAWDAEEPALLGSTEWVEHHAKMLNDNVAVYINTDSNGRGFLSVGGSHSLERLVNEVARDVDDPQTGVSVLERARSQKLVSADAKTREALLEREDLPIAALGSGSDYSPFLQHLGITSLNVGFGGESEGGAYHTLFDTFEHYTRFGDPEFRYGVTLAEVCGRLVLRLSQADVLPFEFTNSAETFAGYVDEVVELADTMRAETEATNRMIEEGLFELAADPTKKFVPVEPKSPVPHINFAELLNARDQLRASAEDFARRRDAQVDVGSRLSTADLAGLNERLYQSESRLTRREGLPRRPWFRHHVYAPGFYTGYGVKTLPGVREAIEQRNWQEAEEQIELLAEMLASYADQIDQATSMISQGADSADVE